MLQSVTVSRDSVQPAFLTYGKDLKVYSKLNEIMDLYHAKQIVTSLQNPDIGDKLSEVISKVEEMFQQSQRKDAENIHWLVITNNLKSASLIKSQIEASKIKRIVTRIFITDNIDKNQIIDLVGKNNFKILSYGDAVVAGNHHCFFKDVN